MQVRVCLKVTMCRRCIARSVVRNKLLCRLGTNSRELVGASLHAGRLGGDLSSVVPRFRRFGVERERHEQLEVVSRCIGVQQGSDKLSVRKGGAGFGLRKMVGIERTPLWEVCKVYTARALRMREERDVEDCASMVSTSAWEFIEELWAAPRGFYNYLSSSRAGVF